jgi:hypothetical protein
MEFGFYLNESAYIYSDFLGIDITINSGVLLGIIAIGYAIKLLKKDGIKNDKK